MGNQKMITVPSKSDIKVGDWVKIELVNKKERKKSGLKLMEDL